MALRYWYLNDAGVITEMTTRINDPLKVTIKAEEGVAAGSSLLVHDPLGDFNIRGMRKVYMTEDAVVDPTNRTIAVAYVGQRTVKRGSPWVGRARDWVIDLWDLNTLLERRIMVGPDTDRPAESDIERLTWLMSTTEAGLFADDDFIFPESPTQMDKVKYRGQSMKAIIDDCAQQSGKNYYGFNKDTGDPSAGDDSHHDAHLWYGHDLRDDREARIRLSNVAADHDPDGDVPTLIIDDNPSAELTRSPDRVASGAYVQYDGNNAYVRRAATAVEFADRDIVFPAPNVKTKPKAEARGRRYLNTLHTEEDIIKTAVTVPAALVNSAMEGERIEARFEHLPGYEDAFTWMRIVERTPEQLSPAEYRISMTLAAPTPGSPVVGARGQLQGSAGPYPYPSGPVYFANVADTPGAGWEHIPTTGLIEALLDGSPPDAIRPYYGWKMLGDGDVTVRAVLSFYGVLVSGTYTVTCTITKNGVAIATDSRMMTGNLVGWSDTFILTATDEPVVADDEIEVRLSSEPGLAFFRTPAGAGNGEVLEIIGGTLA